MVGPQWAWTPWLLSWYWLLQMAFTISCVWGGPTSLNALRQGDPYIHQQSSTSLVQDYGLSPGANELLRGELKSVLIEQYNSIYSMPLAGRKHTGEHVITISSYKSWQFMETLDICCHKISFGVNCEPTWFLSWQDYSKCQSMPWYQMFSERVLGEVFAINFFCKVDLKCFWKRLMWWIYIWGKWISVIFV